MAGKAPNRTARGSNGQALKALQGTVPGPCFSLTKSESSQFPVKLCKSSPS
jgi:hypothetical protein